MERVEGGPRRSVPPPCKEKSAILHSSVSFQALALQLLPNAFARGIYEAIDDLQQSARAPFQSFQRSTAETEKVGRDLLQSFH